MAKIIESRRILKSRLDAKQDVLRAIPALMGDGNGNVAIANQPGYVYVRIGDGDLGQAFNNRCPQRDNLAIYVGYDPVIDPDRRTFQVLSVRMSDYAGAGNTPIMNIPPHHAYHEYGGGDDVYVDWRRLMGLRVGRPSGFSVTTDPGVILRAGAWTAIAAQTLNLTALKPAGLQQARYVLIALNAAGVATATPGALKTIATLAISDCPIPAAGEIPLGAVRLYGIQTSIGDTPSAPDIVDLRFPQSAMAGTVYLSSLSGWARGSIIRGGAAVWESYAKGAAFAVLTGDGTDTAWSTYLLSGTAGGKMNFAVTNAKTLTLTAVDDYNITIPKTGTVPVGTGTATYIAEWVTDANTLQASTLIKTGTNSLTLATGIAAATIWTIPINAVGVLTNDGAGALSWGAGGGAPGGLDTQVQYNNAGAFGGAVIIYNPDFLGAGIPAFGTPVGGNSALGLYGGDASPASDADGDGFYMLGGAGDGVGGGGTFIANAGPGGLTGDGGNLNFVAGNGGATSGNGGVISLSCGNAGGAGNGGDMTFLLGAGAGGGVAGKLYLQNPAGFRAELDISLLASADRTFTFPDVAGTFALGAGTLTSITTNDVTVAAHTHAITGAPALLGNGTAQYQTIVTGANPYVPVYSGFLFDGTTGGKTVFAVTNTKTLTFTAANDLNLTMTGGATTLGFGATGRTYTFPDTAGTVALLETANVFTSTNQFVNIGVGVAPLATRAIYSSSTTTATSSVYYGADVTVYSNPAGASSLTLCGLSGTARITAGNAQNHTGSIIGLVGNVINQNTATVSAVSCITAALNNASTGTISQVHIFDFTVSNAGGGTITNLYGIYVPAITAGSTLNYAIYTNAGAVRLGDTLTVVGAFGCNTKAAQTAYASGGAVAPGAGAFGASSAANFAALATLVANIRLALVANGIMS